MFPKNVKVIEVGPRDGFQNIKEFIPTEKKLKTIDLLLESGIKEMEVTSFVHPKAIPQMADAAEVAKKTVEKYAGGVKLTALIPNAKGAENAISCGIREVAYVISVSEAHNKNNINRTVKESMIELNTLLKAYPELNIRLDAATSFGCPFQGEVPEEAVIAFLEEAISYGIREITLCDTIGVANPLQTESLCGKVKERFPDISVGLHMHDTRGMGLANMLAGMKMGITDFETSVGGLGGCPFAPGAAGNTASEDFINMLNGMGIENGIDFEKYMIAAQYVRDNIYSELTGHMVKVCKG